MSEHAATAEPMSSALYEVQHDRAKLGMWLFLASEIMFFTGFIGAYIVLRMNNAGVALYEQHYMNGGKLLHDAKTMEGTVVTGFVEHETDKDYTILDSTGATVMAPKSENKNTKSEDVHGTRHLAVINTVFLILSSLTMAMAVHSAHQKHQLATSIFLMITILLGCGFMVVKGFEYSAKFGHGIFPSTSPFFSAYFTMTGFHGLHVFAGIIALLGLLGGSMSGAYSKGHYRPVEITGLYWHLVDLVWIFLFPILYLI
jgi:cytochrome c oxidase subunit 3